MTTPCIGPPRPVVPGRVIRWSKFHTTMNLKVMGGIGVGISDRQALAMLSARNTTVAAGVSQMQADILPATHAGMNKGTLRYAASRLSSAAKSGDQNLDTHPRYLKHRSDADVTGCTAAFERVKAYSQASETVGLRAAIFGAPSGSVRAVTPPAPKMKNPKPGDRWTPELLSPPAVGDGHYSFFEFCALWGGTLRSHRGECMLYLQGDPSSRHVRVKPGQKKGEPRIPGEKSTAYARYKLWREHGKPSTLALLAETPGIACVAHGGWGKGKTGKPVIETLPETNNVTAKHLDSRGGTNGKKATERRLNAKKRQSLEAKGLQPTKKQATVCASTIAHYHGLQTAGKDAIKIAKAVDNTGPR